MKIKLLICSLSLISIISTSWAYTIKLNNKTDVPIKMTVSVPDNCPKTSITVDPHTVGKQHNIQKNCCVSSIGFAVNETRAKELGLNKATTKIEGTWLIHGGCINRNQSYTATVQYGRLSINLQEEKVKLPY